MSNRSDPSQIWRVNNDAKTAFTLGNMLLKDNNIGIKNSKESSKYQSTMIQKIGDMAYRRTKFTEEFPITILFFPSSGFAPDYFSFADIEFCSERLRDALSQPPDVIDYTPVDLHCSGAKAIARAYQRMRIIAVQPAMDMQRSLYETNEFVHPETGEVIFSLGDIEKLVLHENFEPRSEILSVAESLVDVLATDALAERVLKAGCTGLEFQHLDTPDYHVGIPITVRTKRGIRLRG